MTSRGLRNNNPLNIRKGNDWQGETKGTDPLFETFSSMAFGYRAAIKILYKYYHAYKCDTITKIISKWAPNNENDTVNYINIVSKRTAIQKDAKLTWNKKDICNIVAAMSYVENGVAANMNDVYEGWELACK